MRLIDADALEKEIEEKDIMGGLNYRWYIRNAPTVDVLDKIRADIEAARYGLINDGLDVALRIIDKHIEGSK